MDTSKFEFVAENEVDLRGLRLDWFRFQAYVSVCRSAFSLENDRRLAVTMNTTVFHLKMIDLLDEMLRETSDLSVYWLRFLITVVDSLVLFYMSVEGKNYLLFRACRCVYASYHFGATVCYAMIALSSYITFNVTSHYVLM